MRMLQVGGVFCLVMSSAFAQPEAGSNADVLAARGALFYAPFEGTAEAAIAHGRAAPLAEKALTFVEGKVGRAVFVTNRLGQHNSSMLVYDALGNVYPRRGTIWFWVKSPWAGTNRDILTGSAYTGPTILSLAATELHQAFLWFCRRKSFFDMRLYGTPQSGNLERFGVFSTKLVALWQANEWQHVAFVWDDRSGYAFYHNGEKLHEYAGEIAWDMNTPANIALGHSTLRAGDLWPVTSDLHFDEFVVFPRPLEPGEIRAVMAGQYDALRPPRDDDWPFAAQARRRDLNLMPDPQRPTVTVTAAQGAALAIRQLAVEEVHMPFHRRYTLVDGMSGTGVHFRDGGLPFDIEARFEFTRPEICTLVVADVPDPRGMTIREPGDGKQLGEIRPGQRYLHVPQRKRGALHAFFPGNSAANEFAFYRLDKPTADSNAGARRYLLSGPVPGNQFADAARVMLRTLHPADRCALNATTDAQPPLQTLRRPALAHTYLVVAAAAEDRFVDAVRVHLPMKSAAAAGATAMRIHGPLIPGRVVSAVELDLRWRAPGKRLPLDVTVHPTGLVIPAQAHLVIDLVFDVEVELGGEGGAFVELLEGDRERIGHEFALAQLRLMWPAFQRRLNQNRFLRPGEVKERNPIWLGLTRAERYDPDNAQVRAWWGWSRLRPWPAYDFHGLETQPGPRWAVYLREGVKSMQAVIHWWLDHRANADAYLVGGGNQWNDITKLYNKYLALGAMAGDARLVDAIQRYLDAHWNSGRMVHGYIYYLTDITHSCEEASYIQPSLHVLRPGIPRNVYRDLLTVSNYRSWLGTNAAGHTHFRSNFFNAESLELEGVHGRDKAGCAAATVPGRFLCWYNGHPPTAKLLTALGDAWLADTLRAADEKVAGMIPAAVDFETDTLIAGGHEVTLVTEQFLALTQLTGEKKYLEPLRLLLEHGETLTKARWPLSHTLDLVSLWTLEPQPELPRQVAAFVDQRFEQFRADAFFQRGIEREEGAGLMRWVTERRRDDLIELLKYVIRNNRRSFFAYCQTDPPTDRVYPWGRPTLPVAMLGGRLFDGRASDPLPTAAFRWHDNDADLVSLVLARAPTRLEVVAYSFKADTTTVGLSLLQLPEGRYRLELAPDRDDDWRPDGEPRTREVELRRFVPCRIDVPPRETLWFRLELIRERPALPRPDLAVTLVEPVDAGRRVSARLHNLGSAPAATVSVELAHPEKGTLATATVDAIPALRGYEPQTRDTVLELPEHVDPQTCFLRVDPANDIDEINEANNTYALRLGTPPPVESAPAQKD